MSRMVYYDSTGNEVFPEPESAIVTTHADRIRSMTDEELARLLVHNPWMREESALAWLKSPVEEVE